MRRRREIIVSELVVGLYDVVTEETQRTRRSGAITNVTGFGCGPGCAVYSLNIGGSDYCGKRGSAYTETSSFKGYCENSQSTLQSARMDRPSDNLLSRLEQSLRQSRAARMHLAARLRELEAEADSVRAELAEMDNLASQTEAAIYRLLSSVLNSSNLSLGLPSDAELEAAMRQSPGANRAQPSIDRRQPIPSVRNNVEVLSDRFMDRTIPQAVTLLLREEGGPLHVNELYNRLLEGGFKFTGQNPTISIAVSLNRNSRFRKVAPGTFDLVMRDASKAS